MTIITESGIIQAMFTKEGVNIMMNENLLKAIDSTMEKQLNDSIKMKKEYDPLLKVYRDGGSKDSELRSKLLKLEKEYEKACVSYVEASKDKNSYIKMAHKVETLIITVENLTKIKCSKEEKARIRNEYNETLADFRDYESLLLKKYNIELNNEKKEEVTEVKEPNGKLLKGVSIALAAVALGGIAYHIGTLNSEKDKTNSVEDKSNVQVSQTPSLVETPTVTDNLVVTETPEVTQTPTVTESQDLSGEIGTFVDSSDPELVQARANWYFENYFDGLSNDLSDVAKTTLTKENLADDIAIASGELPLYEDFNTNDLIEYNNSLVQMFCSYTSLDKNEKAGFIPTQYIFEDGSYEQKCASEVDEVMEKIVDAINNKDNEAYKKYSIEFGEIMRDQYYNVDQTDEHYNVRGLADFSSQIHLYSLAYAEYTNIIMPYGINNNINVCVPMCVDHSTGEMVKYPLSKLMATLEFVPVNQWDAVIARSGYTVKDLEKLGNNTTEETMPVAFTHNAKEQYQGLKLTLK